MSVALQNAQSFKAEQERIAELQIINSIQQGLAAELDFQAIVDLVGDKLREVFNTPDLSIRWFDEKANLLHFLYEYVHGVRETIAPVPPLAGGPFEVMRQTHEPTIIGTAEDYADTIRNSGDALLTIINDILDFSKIEAGKMELEDQPFNLRECIDSALDLVVTRAAEHHLDLACLIEEDVPQAISGDVTRLRQILLNLLSNAVKFTERGEVVVIVKKTGELKNSQILQFSVRDTGIGIPQDRMNRLFESFSQVDASTCENMAARGWGWRSANALSN